MVIAAQSFTTPLSEIIKPYSAGKRKQKCHPNQDGISMLHFKKTLKDAKRGSALNWAVTFRILFFLREKCRCHPIVLQF